MKRLMRNLVWVLLFMSFIPLTLSAKPVDKLEQLERRFQKPLAPKLTLEGEIEIPEFKGQGLPPGVKQKLFTLADIVVEGVTVNIDFLPLYEKFLDKTISLADIYMVAEKITMQYQYSGYILSQAFIPAQTIQNQNGIVRIIVIEGHIDRVNFEGDLAGRQSLLNDYAQKITGSRPLQMKDLERYLALIKALPGTTVKSNLKPSDEIGAVLLTLTLEHKVIDTSLSFDNRGTENVGPYQCMIELGLNSVFGLYEKTNLLFAGTTEIDELKYFWLSHSEILNAEGLTLEFSGSLSQSEPGEALLDIDLTSESLAFSTQLSYPLIRSSKRNLFTYLGLAYRDSQVDLFDKEFSKDRIRTFRAGLNFDHLSSLLNLEISQGLNVLSATTRSGRHSNFTKLTANLSRLQKLQKNLSVYAVLSGQWANKVLPASEEFAIGGANIGRAYDPSEITGDQGFAGLLELRSSLEFGSLALQLFVYTDYGKVYQVGGKNGDLSSGGAGLRLGFKNWIVSVELAKPLACNVAAEGDNDPRVFFSVRGGF